MTCPKSHEELIDYLYGDLSAAKKQEVGAHVATCSKCQDELDGLRETAALLNFATDEPARLNLTFVPVSKPEPNRLIPSLPVLKRFGLGLAFGAALLIAALSLSRFQVSYGNGGFSAQFGAPAVPDPALTAARLDPHDQIFARKEELDRYKQQTTENFERLLLAAEERQKKENRLVLKTLLEDLELQRRQDLQLVERGIETYHLSNRAGLLRTNKVLDYLIRVAGAQNNQLRAIQINGRSKE